MELTISWLTSDSAKGKTQNGSLKAKQHEFISPGVCCTNKKQLFFKLNMEETFEAHGERARDAMQQRQAEFRWDREDVTEEVGRRRWRCNQEGSRPQGSVSEESFINHRLTCIQQFRLLIESPSAIIEARYCIGSGLLYQMRHLLSVNLHLLHTVFLFLRCNQAPYLCSDHLLSPELLYATVLYIIIIRSESCQ